MTTTTTHTMSLTVATHARRSFALLRQLFGGNIDRFPKSAKSERPPYMALHFDYQGRDGDKVRVALSHYYKQNGDMVPDPDMVIEVDREAQTAEALTFQNAMLYHDATTENGGRHERLSQSINSFLVTWLQNAIEQGHLLHEPGPGLRLAFSQLTTSNQQRARATFINAGSSDGFVYELDSEGVVLSRSRAP